MLASLQSISAPLPHSPPKLGFLWNGPVVASPGRQQEVDAYDAILSELISPCPSPAGDSQLSALLNMLSDLHCH